MLMDYEQQVVIRALDQLSRLGEIDPGDKSRAASWILNDCDESQLLKIVKLAHSYNRRRSPEARDAFLQGVLKPESLLEESAD